MSLDLLEARHIEYLINCGDAAMLDALLALKKLARVWKKRSEQDLSQGNHD